MSLVGTLAETFGSVFGTARANLDGVDVDAVLTYEAPSGLPPRYKISNRRTARSADDWFLLVFSELKLVFIVFRIKIDIFCIVYLPF